MLRFYDRFLECHLPTTFLKILCFVSKGSLNIPEYICLLVVRVQYLYTIEHAVENIAYYRFQSISVTLLIISGVKLAELHILRHES